MNVKKLCRRGNNTNHKEDCSGVCLSRIHCLPLSSLSGYAPDDVRWCPTLALSSLFKITSDLQCVVVCFRFGQSLLFCPACFPSALGPGVILLVTQENCLSLLHLLPEGVPSAIRRMGILFHPQGTLFSLQRRWWECFPAPSPHNLLCPSFFLVMCGFW